MKHRSPLLVMLLTCVAMAAWSASEPVPAPAQALAGNYRTADGRVFGIDAFVMDDGTSTALFTDYAARSVRRLFTVADDEYEIGHGFSQQQPAELHVRVRRDRDGNVAGLALRRGDASAAIAERVPLREREVVIPSGQAQLAGTLIMPPGAGPHPAVVLLHGSGPLTRHSFGPYPHFFSSLGFAVLVYDKRGTGKSGGELFDTSSPILPGLPAERFPERLAGDAHAAVAFLRGQPGIDANQVGLWGASEGGILTARVAAEDPRIAFIIDSSGAIAPLWETRLYQAGLSLRARGFTDAQVQEVKVATQQWVDVARTGEGFEAMMDVRRQSLEKKEGWRVGWTPLSASTIEELRWHWDHVASYDPRQDLAKVKAPVLALFGELDTATDTAASARNVADTLRQTGHTDHTVKVIEGAGHSLMEQPGGAFMAKGVFETLESWLRERVNFAR